MGVMLCYTGLTSAFGTITVPRRRGIGPMQLRRKRAHPCCSRSQQTGTGWPSKRGSHQASSARESKPGPAHPHRDEVKMQDAASTREGKQPCTQSMMTRMQSKEICERVRKGKEESNASRARAGRGRENGDVGPLKPGSPRAGAGAQTRCCGCRLQPTTDGSNGAQSWPPPPIPAQGTVPRFPAPPTDLWAGPDRPPKGTRCNRHAGGHTLGSQTPCDARPPQHPTSSGGKSGWACPTPHAAQSPPATNVMLHVFNVCLRDNHCPSQTGHRAHATQTQTGPSLLQPEPADRNGLALETGNSSGQQRTGVKARARAPPSRRGEDARCSKHTGGQATMHAKHDDKDAKQGNL
jgi:hypothetical protein